MPATASQSPLYPIKGQPVSLSFSGLDPASTAIRLIPISAPVGSATRKRLDENKGQRVIEYQGDASKPWSFAADVGGVYTFSLEETSETPASLGMFAGDTSGAPDPTITQTSTISFYIGEAMRIKVGQAPDHCFVKVWVWNNTIRPTTVATHGEVTPAAVDAVTPAAKNAIESPAFKAAVGVLANLDTSTVSGEFSEEFETVRAEYATHIANSSHHATVDTFNPVPSSWKADNAKSAERAVNELRRQLEAHSKKTSVADFTPPVHSSPDGTSSYQSSGAGSDRASQYFALADAHVRLREHKGLASVHTSPDTSTVAFGSPLMNIFVRYIQALKASVPVAPATKNSGAALLGQLAGFEDVA